MPDIERAIDLFEKIAEITEEKNKNKSCHYIVTEALSAISKH